MVEITNAVYLGCVRTSTEIVEGLTLEQVNSSIMKFSESDKRAILSQKLAKEMFDTLGEVKNEEPKR